MTSDEKPQLLLHAKYLWKAPHCHFQGRGKNNNPSALLHIHFRMQQKPHTLFTKTTKTQVYVGEMESLMASYRLC